ncbi:GNAT family N-acetyltransferase [Viridibacillus sp. NPDC096237]
MSYGEDKLGLTYIEATTAQENQALTALFEKFGFRFERLVQLGNYPERD